jgi:hypothetical protein
MGTPTPYYNAKKKRVPSVSTISGKFKDHGALMWWANQVGQGEAACEDQEPCQKCGRKQGKNHRDAAQKSADVGTYAHALIEERVKGTPIDMSEFDGFTDEQFSKAGSCLDAFDNWFDGSKVEVIETEMPLVSEKYQFGGRFDAIWRVNGRLSLGDWKTSNGLYEDYVAQVCGGYLLLIEEHDLWGPVERVDILRFSKETGSFNHHSWPRESLQPAIDYFLTARRLYDEAKGLKKLLK